MLIETLIGVLVPFAGTTLGSACVFFMKKALHPGVQRALTGFAAGVMVAASFWSLLSPALEQSAALGRLSFLPAFIGFWLGDGFLLALDMLLQREKKPIGKVPSILLGIVAGLVCGMYGVGALAAAYVSRATDSNESYRGSLCIVFTLDNLFRIALYFATGILNLEIAARALQLLPMMLIGLTAGIWTVKKVSPDWIRRAVILALIVSGAALIINNI